MPFHRDLKGPALHAPTNERVENNSGVTIQKLQVVSLDGHGSLFPQVVLADPNTQSNFGIAMQEMVDGTNGYVTTLGFMVNVDTSAWTVNTILYSDANGNLTTTSLGSPVALVIKQDDSCGVMYVTGFVDFAASQVPAWYLLGNDGTDEDVNFIGTRDDMGLSFKTNSELRMFMSNDGKMSIGDFKPESFFHLKQHEGYEGSGKRIETAAVTTSDTAYNNIYSFVVPDASTIIIKANVVGIEDGNTGRATFTRTASFYRQGSLAQQQGLTQTDYTYKSAKEFDVIFSKTGDTVLLQVKGASLKDTLWNSTIEIDVIKNP